MSKHTSRKSRWTKVSPKEYRAAFGTVRYQAGAWEGTVSYEVMQPDAAEPAWHAESAYAGRFKRPRNAMIAVEDKARELRRHLKENAKVAFDG